MELYDLAVKNGIVVDGKGMERKHVYIRQGKVAALTDEVYESKDTIDAKGLYVLPGCIDTHCHFRDPGATYKEDFWHGTRAAAVGGITTVFDMPNTNPAVLTGASVGEKAAYFHGRAWVDYCLWGLCLGKLNNDEILNMRTAGAVAFKFFWGYAIHAKTHQLIYNYQPGQADIIPPLEDGEVYEIFEKIARSGAMLGIHAENSELIHTLTERVMKAGRGDYEALLEARPNLAEALTTQTAIAFSKATGAKLHILHVTSAETVALVRRAKADNLPVTAETCPHFLFLSADDYERLGSAMKVYPPVKRESDRLALWQGLKDGTLDYVASDHAPHSVKEKQGGLFEIPSGMCGVETMLPMMLDEVNLGHITLPFVVRTLAENQAKLYGLYPRKGSLLPGADADLVLADLSLKKAIRNQDLHSKEPMTVFDGKENTGWPVATILRGRLIAKDGNILAERPEGAWLRYKTTK